MKRYLFAALLLFVVASSSTAGPYVTGPPMERAERMKLAATLSDGFAKLRREVPTLSPSERDWLQREEKESLDENGKITRRYLELTNSREWALRNLEAPLVTMLNALVAIQNGKEPGQELLHWTVVVGVLTDYSFWDSINTLIERNLVDPKAVEFIMPYKDHLLLFATATLRARDILQKIVIPSLNAR